MPTTNQLLAAELAHGGDTHGPWERFHPGWRLQARQQVEKRPDCRKARSTIKHLRLSESEATAMRTHTEMRSGLNQYQEDQRKSLISFWRLIR